MPTADETERAFWQRTLEASDQHDEDLDHAMLLMSKHGAIGKTLDRAAEFADTAKASLEIFPDSPIRRSLLAIGDYTVRRGR